MRFLILFGILLTISKAFSQSSFDAPIGVWKVYPSTRSFSTVELVGNKIFAGSSEAFISYDTQDGAVKILSKNDGFSDQGISKIAYYSEKNITIIGYENGNIDLIKGQEIVNINDIKRKSISGSKKINHISFSGKNAYLSMGLGLAVIDLEKEEVKDAALNIGQGGKPLEIYASCIKNDSIFIASSEGIKSALLNTNLLNFNNWRLHTKLNGIPTGYVTSVVNYNKQVYALITNYFVGGTVVNTDSAGLYVYNGHFWNKIIDVVLPSHALNVSGGKILISCDGRVEMYSAGGVETIFFNGIAMEAALDNQNKIWVANKNFGLGTNLNGKYEVLKINSPYYGIPFKLAYFNNRLVNLFGGYYSSTPSYMSTNGFDIYFEGLWKNYSINNQNITGKDFVDATYNKYDKCTYLASYGYGVVKLNGDSVVKIYNDQNSPLVNLNPGPYVMVGAVAVDSSGILWVANRVQNSTSSLLYSKTIDDKWNSHFIKYTFGDFLPKELIIDGRNNKWVRFKQKESASLVVYNENAAVTSRFFKAGSGLGGLPDANVTAIAVDKNGDIWIGTNKGIAIFKNGYNPMKDDFTIPYFDGFPLLMNKEITAIKVDGGNRKWIGTKDGLWLFNSDAAEVMHFFDENNSPLPVSEVNDIEISDNTGEVFISTSKGLVSYRGDATEGLVGKFSNVKVFPNPVKPDFDGMIGISGLAQNANVKITDVYGNMVYETHAEGGTASWSGRNFKGEKVNTGVYLILSATQDGQEGYVAKVAFIK